MKRVTGPCTVSGKALGLWPSVTYYDVSSLLLRTNEASGGCLVFQNQPFLLFSKTEKKATPHPPQKELSKSSTMPNFQRRPC